MTALEKYIRLESLGRWKETPESVAKEVLVSFGNATLVLSDTSDVPFSHWSLVATRLISWSGDKAIYSADDDGFETLEIEDPEMIKAITKISQAASGGKRRINWAFWLVIILLISAGYSTYRFGPAMLLDQAKRMTSQDSARQFASEIVSQMRLEQCREVGANQALRKLEETLFPQGEFELAIMRNGPSGLILPGGIILLDERRLKEFQSSNDLAEWIIANSQTEINHYTAHELLDDSTNGDLISYVTSGKIPDERIMNVSEEVLYIFTGEIFVSQSDSDVEQLLQEQEWLNILNICLL